MATERSLAVGGQAIALTPQDVVANATVQAKLLMDIVEKTKCFTVINEKKYLWVEAWETIGAFNSVHAVTESITPIIKDGATVGYDAKVNLVNRDGLIVGSAIMPCYFTENACKGKEGDAKDKASKSAAQTFATSKAYRMNYSYVAILAGYQPTPAEEMTSEGTEHGRTEHFCKIHNTAFFKKGKMKNFAHPIGDSGKWCDEHKEDNEKAKPAPVLEQPAPSQPEVVAESAPPEQDLGINMVWLRESLPKAHWTEKTAKTWLSQFKVDTTGSLEEVLSQLTQEQKQRFVDQIQERLELV